MRSPAANGRRAFLGSLAGSAAALLLAPRSAGAQQPPITRAVPSTGEALPVVGLGSWITFNVGDDRTARDECADVMRVFFEAGGRMIDSSPMYGSSQQVIGYGLRKLGMPAPLFSADKVWIASGSRGAAQIEESRTHWSVPRFDLLQVHNLLSWRDHLPLLFAMKAAGRLRYVGITTSEGRRHADIEAIMRAHPLDFVQVTYNAVDRDVEARILPLARERGIAVIVNRPFRQGAPDQCDAVGEASVVRGRRRMCQLGRAAAEVRGVASGRHLRDPRDDERGARAGEHGCGPRTAAR
jgi:diketogulonate reductase-like aldo/keto reductase